MLRSSRQLDPKLNLKQFDTA